MRAFASIAASAASLALLVANVGAQDFMINTPGNVVQCEPTLITWSGGSPPYILNVEPGSSPTGPSIEQFTGLSGSQFTWDVNIQGGQSVSLTLVDSTGANKQTAPFPINTSSNSTCLTSGASAPSSTASGGASSSAVSASSAASSASSAISSVVSSASSVISSAVSSISSAASSAASSGSSAATSSGSSAASHSSAASETTSHPSASASATGSSSNGAAQLSGMSVAGVITVIAAVMAMA